MSGSNDTLIISETNEETLEEVPVKTVTSVTNEEKEELCENTTPEEKKELCENTTPEEKKEFNRVNIEALGNLVNTVDSDQENKLDMLCYVKCSENDSTLLKKCRGVVFNGDNLVMKAFPYTIEYNHTQLKEVEKVFDDFKNWSFFESHEGALIRFFYFGEKWYISTHRKLNAFKSKWSSSESFGTSFKNALNSEVEHNEDFKNSLPDGDNILERFQSNLDKKKQYMFLVCNNTDNRIVCSVPERPTAYHVGTFVDGKLVWDENVYLPTPKKISLTSVEEVFEFVENISYKEIQGLIAFDEVKQRVVKVYHKDYQDLFSARGNEPSIKFRYLQVRMNRRSLNMLCHLYPQMVQTFDDYENTLYDIACSIYNSYVQRFIKKSFVTVPREEFAIIRKCHSWHLENRDSNRISINKVIEVMNQAPPTHLNHMIRRTKIEQNRRNGNPTPISGEPTNPTIKNIKI